MSLKCASHQEELRAAGWHSRGYLPHFDGRPLPQFITLRLADSVPKHVIDNWKRELGTTASVADQILLRKRVEKYLDQGYGEALLSDYRVADMVQQALLSDDGKKYRLFSWVVMPNHVHLLTTRTDEFPLGNILQSFKSLTAHKANMILRRRGTFWMPDYFDRYIRNEDHFRKTTLYIESNPVNAKLCKKREDWPFSSAWFKKLG
jgi:REP element-mobilizing transposase RayT